jgi:hypothetical protein
VNCAPTNPHLALLRHPAETAAPVPPYASGDEHAFATQDASAIASA